MQPRTNPTNTEKSTARIPQNSITISSPASSKTDSPRSPTSPHYPPTSWGADPAPSSPSAHTSAHENSPPPPWAGRSDCEHRILNWTVSARAAARTSNSSTRRWAAPGVPSGEAVIAACRIPAVRRSGRSGLVVVERRSLSLVSRARLAVLGAAVVVGGGRVENRGLVRAAGV